MEPPILAYCLNVHPGETLDELVTTLGGPARRVREALGRARMGAGLWLPREVARAIVEEPGAAERVREALAGAGLFAFTANAFPIGGFHAQRVKREVYRPSWIDPARLEYTRLACRALAALLPEGTRGSVSSVPVTYRAFSDAADQELAGVHLGQLALELRALEQETGRELALALEPEPMALLETTDEALAFLRKHVLGGAARRVLEQAGLGRAAAEAELRRRIGLCVDACHVACAFEQVPDVLERLAAEGVRVVKAQLSSALELQDPAVNDEGRRRLQSYSEPRYLHQSIALDGSHLPERRLLHAEDLPELLDQDGSLAPAYVNAAVVRTHFHVPVCWEGDELLATTQPDLLDGLAPLAAATDHLEVETYTWEVLPAEQRARFEDDVVQMLAAELRWAIVALEERGVRTR